MASKQATKRRGSAHLIAPVTPDSWDPDARQDANDPALMAALEEARRNAREPGGLVSAEDVLREFAFTDQELADARAAVDRQVAEAERQQEEGPRGRPTGRRSKQGADLSGRLVVRFPKSVHRELAERADVEGVSLNQLILAYVSRGLGQDAGPAVR